jgi:hypothetical protein
MKTYTEEDLRNAFKAGEIKGMYPSYNQGELDEDEWIKEYTNKTAANIEEIFKDCNKYFIEIAYRNTETAILLKDAINVVNKLLNNENNHI